MRQPVLCSYRSRLRLLHDLEVLFPAFIIDNLQRKLEYAVTERVHQDIVQFQPIYAFIQIIERDALLPRDT